MVYLFLVDTTALTRKFESEIKMNRFYKSIILSVKSHKS